MSKRNAARRIVAQQLSAVDRLLMPGNTSATLQTLTKGDRAIGRDLPIELH